MYWDLVAHNKAYQVIASREVISAFGDDFTDVANTVVLLGFWQGPLAVSLYMSLNTGIVGVVSLLAGSVMDRHSKVHIVICSDIASTIIRALLIASFLYKSPALFIACSVANALIKSVSHPAADSYFPEVIEKKHLPVANALTETLESFVHVLAYGVGGFFTACVGVIGSFIVDAVTFVIGASLFSTFICAKSRYKFVQTLDADTRTAVRSSSLWQLAIETLRYIRAHRELFIQMLVLTWSSLVLATISVYNVMLAKRYFAEAHASHEYDANDAYLLLGHGSSDDKKLSLALGLCYTVSSLGSALGPIIGTYTTRASSTVAVRWYMALAIFVCAAGNALIGVNERFNSAWLWLLGNFLFCYGNYTLLVFIKTVFQMDVDLHMRGRVFASSAALNTVFKTISQLAIGYLIKHGRALETFMITSGATMIILVLWVFLFIPQTKIDPLLLHDDDTYESEGV